MSLLTMDNKESDIDFVFLAFSACRTFKGQTGRIFRYLLSRHFADRKPAR